jgi:hypothetical protein
MNSPDLQQLDTRPLFDRIGCRVLASVDRGRKRPGLVSRRQPGEAAGQPTDPAEMEAILILSGGFEISSDR